MPQFHQRTAAPNAGFSRAVGSGSGSISRAFRGQGTAYVTRAPSCRHRNCNYYHTCLSTKCTQRPRNVILEDPRTFSSSRDRGRRQRACLAHDIIAVTSGSSRRYHVILPTSGSIRVHLARKTRSFSEEFPRPPSSPKAGRSTSVSSSAPGEWVRSWSVSAGNECDVSAERFCLTFSSGLRVRLGNWLVLSKNERIRFVFENVNESSPILERNYVTRACTKRKMQCILIFWQKLHNSFF